MTRTSTATTGTTGTGAATRETSRPAVRRPASSVSSRGTRTAAAIVGATASQDGGRPAGGMTGAPVRASRSFAAGLNDTIARADVARRARERAARRDARAAAAKRRKAADHAILQTLEPHRFRGGEEAGRCVDHPSRWSVQFHRDTDGAWVDTGICASDLRGVIRAIRNANRAAARSERGTIAGEIGRSRSRITNTTAIVIDATQPGADANTDPDEARWWVICEPHGGLVTTPTRRQAFSAAVDPSEWCPTCQNDGTDPADTAFADAKRATVFA